MVRYFVGNLLGCGGAVPGSVRRHTSRSSVGTENVTETSAFAILAARAAWFESPPSVVCVNEMFAFTYCLVAGPLPPGPELMSGVAGSVSRTTLLALGGSQPDLASRTAGRASPRQAPPLYDDAPAREAVMQAGPAEAVA